MDIVVAILVVFFALFGAMVGSFLNVCVWRIPREGLSVSSPSRSHCPACGYRIHWSDNIPIISWLVLGGRCRSCGMGISVRYLLVEALTAMLFAVIAYRYFAGGDLAWREAVTMMALASALLVASFVDVDLRILPDEITVSGMMLVAPVALLVPGLHTRPPDPFIWKGLAALRESVVLPASRLIPDALRDGGLAWAVGGVLAALGLVGGMVAFRIYWHLVHRGVPKPFRDGLLAGVLVGFFLPVAWVVSTQPDLLLSPPVVSYVAAMLGAATGATLVFVVGIVGTAVFQKDAMGFGDVKLMGLLGGFAGWTGVVGGFAIACLLGSVVGVWRLVVFRTRYLWFGPFLALGCFLVMLFPEALRRSLDWYLGLFQ